MKLSLATAILVALLSAEVPAGVNVLLVDNGAAVTDVVPRLTGLGHAVTVVDAILLDSSFDYTANDVVAFEFMSPDPADLTHLVAAVGAGHVGVVFFRGYSSEATSLALGLTGGASPDFQPTSLTIVDLTHPITDGLTAGTANLGYGYMTSVPDPASGTTTLATGPTGAALVVHDTYRVVATPFYGHPTAYANETALGLEITDRSVRWAADGCVGAPNAIHAVGTGCSGTGGFVPVLALSGCTSPTQTVSLEVSHAYPQSVAVLLFGFLEASLPTAGTCTLNVSPLFPIYVTLPVGGTPGIPGSGGVVVPVTLPASSAAGTLRLQAFIGDPGVPWGYANTNGVSVTVQ